MTRSPFLLAVALASVHVLCAPAIGAQDAPAPHENSAACLRFQFGTWIPTLNWKGAGHTSTLDTSRVDRSADGRAWAAPSLMASGDSVLVLYPAFWPAGVALSIDARSLAPHDTATVRATAFVADAKVSPPVTTAKVWRVDCH